MVSEVYRWQWRWGGVECELDNSQIHGLLGPLPRLLGHLLGLLHGAVHLSCDVVVVQQKVWFSPLRPGEEDQSAVLIATLLQGAVWKPSLTVSMALILEPLTLVTHSVRPLTDTIALTGISLPRAGKRLNCLRVNCVLLREGAGEGRSGEVEKGREFKTGNNDKYFGTALLF
ncbi:unnamed protein product [Protopolystoma xenopodis]|uniref:Uncharacterized protein n=1 Tax=Protopolystoma xenopodis TaxID=117903 RepID=A0A3S5AUI6_9PLAT|nr:unnamed protein product [Protopolystoma xenopodis]